MDKDEQETFCLNYLSGVMRQTAMYSQENDFRTVEK